MITIRGTTLETNIRQAIKKSASLSKPIVVSDVQKIDKRTALSFFEAGKRSFFGERFFWKDAADEMYMAGVGISKKIYSHETNDRFSIIENKWKDVMEHALISNKYKSVHGTGPLLFGGFSFDPLKEKTALWKNFAHAIFHLPLFMYSEIAGNAYMTTNIVCTEKDNYNDLIYKIEKKKREVFEAMEEKTHYGKNILVHNEEIDTAQWKQSVAEIVEELKDSSLKKIVLARESRLQFSTNVHIQSVLSNLLQLQTDSFTFAFESNGDCFIGASPERLVKKQKDKVDITCLAGSIQRGNTAVEDRELGETLLADKKNIAEHQYVIDMVTEAIEPYMEQFNIPAQPVLIKMRDIQHLYTPLQGVAKESTSLLCLVDQLHPTPALGGFPKVESVEKIREVERLDRGLYGSPLGWFDYKDNGEFAVSIRSGLVQGDEVSIFAGCGVLEDSTVCAEYEETNVKFQPMLSALGGLRQ